MNGQRMFDLQARTTGAGVKGTLNISLGNNNVTSLSVYTTGVVIRGYNGLSVYNATAEDVLGQILIGPGLYTTSGISLYNTPSIDLTSVLASVRAGSDSSNAIAHTGFVKTNLLSYPLSSTALVARRGIVSTKSDLTGDAAFNIDGIYHPKHCEGLIYNYNTSNNIVTLVTGAAAHWSYSTSGVAGVDQTSAIAIVASYTPIKRVFNIGWTPEYTEAGTIPAVIDSALKPDSWYYLYYIGALKTHTVGTRTFYPGSSNVVISSNRDIASVQTQINGVASANGNWAVIRRLGPIKTAPDSTAVTPKIVPFNVKRIDHGAFEFYWGLQGGAWSAGVGYSSSSYTTSITAAAAMKLRSSSDATIALSDYNTASLTSVPPIPGITAFLTVRHTPTAGGSLPYVYLYGNPWTVNLSISTLYPPFEFFRSTATSIANVHNIQVPMSPDGCYIPDGNYTGGAGLLDVMDNTSQVIRYIMQGGEAPGFVTSTALAFTVTGFRYAR
jgi:hypothetical protein